MTAFKTLLRSLILVSVVLTIVLFGYVLVADFVTYRRQAAAPLKFVADFPQAEAFDMPEKLELNVASTLHYRDWRNEQLPENAVLLRAVGDVAPVRVADMQLRKKGMAYAFSGVGDIFAQDDLTLINLETPVIEECPVSNDGMVFCALPAFVGAMRDAGIEFVGLANNHSGNYGEKGMEETLRHLEEGGLLPITDNGLVFATVKGTVFGVLAVNGVTNKGIDRSVVQGLLERAREQADVVVVYVHWGAEYTVEPKVAAGVATDDPKEIGRWMIDEGADLIIGAHPHVVQGVEKYNDGFIAYSHGNFIFDQEWSRETKEGVIGNYVFREKKLVDVYFTPVVIEDWVRPRFADEAESERILSRMRNASGL